MPSKDLSLMVRMRPAFNLMLGIAAGVTLALSGRPSAQSPGRIDFARDVQPLLRANCYGCHGPTLSSGNFRVDLRRDSMPNRVGANGARIVPGNSDASRLFQRVAGAQAGLQMPPTGALQPEEIRTIMEWIDQGADWPDDLAGETPSPPQDPVAAQLLEAIRQGDRRNIARLLKQSPHVVRAAGSGGITPLMFAALYGDQETARLLLHSGANPNARNDAGVTALMWAVDDPEITRLLLAHKADPNLRSADGSSPLLVAAGRSGAADIVKMLLDAGATLDGQPILTQAGDAGDPAIVRLALDGGADTGLMPNDLGLRSGCTECAELLVRAAGRPALTRALQVAARFGDSAAMRMLLDRGAEPTASALRAAAASERAPIDGVIVLLARGARDEQALDLASRHGNTEVVAVLRKAGLNESAAPALTQKRPPEARTPRAAIAVSLPLLQHADNVFLKTAGCVSCHNNTLFQMTAVAARRAGFRVDEAAFRQGLTSIRTYLESWRERELQDIAIPGRIDTTAYILVGLAAAAYPPDPATDALARYVMRRQLADGSWHVSSHRPPIESSDIAVTALSLRSLRAYAPGPLKAEYGRVIQRGVAWLKRAQPQSTEDHAYMLLGLGWVGETTAGLRSAAAALMARQRADGGWSQIPTLGSDAYATGQALTALAHSGALKPSDPIYQRGVRFLLGTQLDDGSWYVRSRAIATQPYFDSEFPHGRDQFISAAATNWATTALTWAVR